MYLKKKHFIVNVKEKCSSIIFVRFDLLQSQLVEFLTLVLLIVNCSVLVDFAMNQCQHDTLVSYIGDTHISEKVSYIADTHTYQRKYDI